MVAAAALAVAGFAVHLRREARRNAQVRRARSGRRRRPVARAPARGARAHRKVDRSIKAGNYEIVAGITLPRLLDKLTAGDVTQTALTVVEGGTFAEFAAAINANPALVKTVLPLPAAELAQRIGLPGTSPEGWFFPDTYFITRARPISRSSSAPIASCASVSTRHGRGARLTPR